MKLQNYSLITPSNDINGTMLGYFQVGLNPLGSHYAPKIVILINMNKVIYLLFTLFITACSDEFVMPEAMQYTPPKLAAKNAKTVFGHPNNIVFNAATSALIKEGYQIANSDLDDGILVTEARNIPLNDTQADCGLLKQTNLLPDNKTTTRVIMNVTIINHKTTVQAEIEGVYQPNNANLTCVSKGLLELDMIKKIRAEVR
jgi:hypothetical protein